ncbi:MAG TPA: histidine kinase [Bacteroidales bacterium]|nr:histidine kinase [Bacteroidales bacterium]
MVSKKYLRYAVRFSIVLILDSLIKGFDQTFKGIFDFSERSVFFILSFSIYWMIGWEIISCVVNIAEHRLKGKLKTVPFFAILTGITISIAAGESILFDLFYRTFDTRLFDMYENWKNVPFPHPDMAYPLMFITILIIAFEEYMKYSAHLENVELRTSILERDNIQAQYQALKNQIDPHFFFNSLSVLSSMIHTDPDTATKYIQNLSRHYRYTLETTRNNIVSIADELNFLDSYLYLMKIRYPECFDVKISIDKSKSNQSGLPSNSLQILIENAIKHNRFKSDCPLEIEISEDDEYICVRNTIRKKNITIPSTGIGLENIRRRYELFCDKKIIIRETAEYFTVKLPRIEIPEK